MPGLYKKSFSFLIFNPLFVNLEQGDYRLLPDSPYIDKGTADAPELLSTDFEGDLRIIGSAPDIGADEYDPSQLQAQVQLRVPVQPCLLQPH